MPNYFYIDTSGQKQGPINDQQLQALAARGAISPTTQLETESGYKGVAGQIPGLNFNTPTSVAQSPNWTNALISAMQVGELAKKAKMGGKLSWLLDFSFRDIRLPEINRLACKVIYIITCILASIVFVVGTVMMFFVLSIGASGRGEASFIAAVFFMWFFISWIVAPLFVCAVRLFCEWYIIVFDWIVETTKAARLYIAEKEATR